MANPPRLDDMLDWPFFEDRHRKLAADLQTWCDQHRSLLDHAQPIEAGPQGRANVDAHCRRLVRALGEGGWLRYGVRGAAYGGHGDTIDTRAVCLLRETLAKHSGLADFALAMQGLGSGAISLAGPDAANIASIRRSQLFWR